MPTARELLEQAEALMRRDRMAALAQDDDFPLLTDAVPEGAPLVEAVEVEAGVPAAPPAPSSAARGGSLAADASAAVEASPSAASPSATPEAIAAPGAPAWQPEPAIARLAQEQAEVAADDQGEPSIWAVPQNEAAAITLAGPDSQSPLRDAEDDGRADAATREGDARWSTEATPIPEESAEAVAAEIAMTADAARGEGAGAPADDFPLDATLDATRWNLMAEDIRMQVLQRIDIFTDTGLREQLTQRLQPIVDRASADLVAAINQHVGQILRAYVAEAIEREIEKWRQEPR